MGGRHIDFLTTHPASDKRSAVRMINFLDLPTISAVGSPALSFSGIEGDAARSVRCASRQPDVRVYDRPHGGL